jgi:DNA-binding transcriptional ArsR family regulator
MPQKRAENMKAEGCRVRVVHLDRVDQARKESIHAHDLDQMALTFKVLGDPTRLKIVLALLNGEMCVCDLSAFLGVSESAVSHQLRRLKDLALIKQRRDKQVLYHSLNDEHVSMLLNIGLEHVREPRGVP